ncbi:MOS1T transposase, partial [Pseudoatta argentina]
KMLVALLVCLIERHYFILKKSAAETHRLLVDIYGEHAPSKTSCKEWFRRFNSGDFDVRDKETEKICKNAELQALLEEDSCLSLDRLAKELNVDRSTVGKRLHTMGMVQKEGNWVPYKLKERDMERRLVICEMLKRSRGRPALNPEHAGKFTAEARARKADKAKARKLIEDHRAIVDPEIEPSSTSVRRANKKAVELALEFDEQPIYAVAAVATRELATISKSVERSKNIRGDIVSDMWTAYTKLSAALTSVLARTSDGNLAADKGGQSNECYGSGAWAEKRRRLNQELVLLCSRVAVMERDKGKSASRGTSGKDRAPGLEGDSTMEWSGLESSTDARSPIRTRCRTATAVTVTEEDLRSPYFRPPLQGVSRQLNPLATVADRVAPAGKNAPPRKKQETDGRDDEDARIERVLERPPPEGNRGGPSDGDAPKGTTRQAGRPTPRKAGRTAPRQEGSQDRQGWRKGT